MAPPPGFTTTGMAPQERMNAQEGGKASRVKPKQHFLKLSPRKENRAKKRSCELHC